MRLAHLLIGFCLVSYFAFAAPITYADEVLTKARDLIRAGQAQEAYELLAPLEGERAGNVDYDYLLGVSALDSGQPGIAIFALERVLAVNPDHVPARTDLARAYFEIKDNELAKQEFETVQEMEAPENVKETIAKYLGALDERFKVLTGIQWSAYVEVGGGHDSNVNAATDESTVALPAFGNLNFTLDASGVEQSSPFVMAEAGLTAAKRLNPRWIAFASGTVNQRINPKAHDFDANTFDATAGFQHSRANDTFTLSGQYQRFSINEDLTKFTLPGSLRLRRTWGATAQWRHIVDAQNQVTVFGQFATIEHTPSAQSLRDVHQKLIGAGWGHAFGGKGSPTVFVSAYGGEDEERESAVAPQFGRRLFGGRIGGQYTMQADTDIFGAFSGQYSNYNCCDPLFLTDRDDELYQATLGLNYRAYKRWTIKPRFEYTRNKSNIPTSDYSRATLYVTARYDFK